MKPFPLRRFGAIALLATLAAAGCSRQEAPPPAQPAGKAVEAAAEPKPAPAPELPPGKPGARSSSGEGDYKPDFAFDGDPSTRWGSGFGDNEWIIFDLGQTREIAGARIDWEAAYGKDYDLLASLDGKTWTRVFSMRDGDGGTDELFFKPGKARFVKLQGIKRGTGWGYSIFEFQPLKSEDLPEIKASGGKNPEQALDGDLATEWKSSQGPVKLSIDLKKRRQVDGIEIEWGKEFPATYEILGSDDGTDWKPLARVTETDGAKDLVYFPSLNCRWLRIQSASESPAAVRELGFKGAEGELTLAKRFEAIATQLPPGALPRWLKRIQTFWTITGVPGDTEETLLGEEGTVEPYRDSFCIMPFLKIGERVFTSNDFKRSHLLEEGYLPLPTARMSREDAELEVSTVSFGKSGESLTAVRYRVRNPSASAPLKGSLNLAVWPLQLNPPWQYGGVSPIREAKFADDGQLKINGRNAIQPMARPDSMAAASALEEGPAFSWIRSGKRPASSQAAEKNGAVSAVLSYDLDLKPGESRDIVLLLPLHERSTLAASKEDGAAFFARTFADQKEWWTKKLGDWNIQCPDAKLPLVVKSNLAYMILNRDLFAAQPGPRNYAKAWMRDGSVSTATYLRFGFNEEAHGYLDWFTPLIRKDGFVPFLIDSKTNAMPDWSRDWKEYDSQGEYVYAVKKYHEFTGDKAFLEKLYPAVVRAMAYLKARLDDRRTDKYKNTEYYGILPESNSHEGYFPGVHSFWDDFWALRGLADAAAIADTLGKKEDAQRFRDEESRLRTDFYAAVKKTMAKGKRKNMPGCAEKSDFDPTSTSIGLTACGELPHLEKDPELAAALQATYNDYVAEQKPRHTPGAVWGGYTPYEARNIEAMVRLGRRQDALDLLEFLIGPSMRPPEWNLLPEVVHFDPATGSYIGDMPHTWVGADLNNAIRSFFVIDDTPVMDLAAGVPAAWLEPGKQVGVENLPALGGKITWTLSRTAPDTLTFEASGTAKTAGGYRLRHPFGANVSSVSVDGADKAVEEGGVRFDKLPARIVVQLKN